MVAALPVTTERPAPPKAGLLLLMPGGVQQQPAHARIPYLRGAMPVHEREPACTRVERGVPRISIITNLDYNAILCTSQLLQATYVRPFDLKPGRMFVICFAKL